MLADRFYFGPTPTEKDNALKKKKKKEEGRKCIQGYLKQHYDLLVMPL